jgi:AraC-like DNA-binding protein
MLFKKLLSTLDIHLLAAGQSRVGREWNYLNINNYYNRIFLVLDGSATLKHHGKTYTLTTGDLHLIPCFSSADYLCDHSLEVAYIHFTSRAVGGLDLCKIQEYNYTRTVTDIDRNAFEQLSTLNPGRELPVTDPAIRLYRTYHDTTDQNYHEISPQLYMENMAYISLLLAPFIATGSLAPSNRVEGRRMYEFATYVEANLHRPFGLSEIAASIGVTPNYLSDWLYSVLKIRPVEYINQRRIEEAQIRLISTDTGIQKIAQDLGFQSPTYFARVFRNQVGVSASHYRNLNRNP